MGDLTVSKPILQHLSAREPQQPAIVRTPRAPAVERAVHTGMRYGQQWLAWRADKPWVKKKVVPVVGQQELITKVQEARTGSHEQRMMFFRLFDAQSVPKQSELAQSDEMKGLIATLCQELYEKKLSREFAFQLMGVMSETIPEFKHFFDCFHSYLIKSSAEIPSQDLLRALVLWSDRFGFVPDTACIAQCVFNRFPEAPSIFIIKVVRFFTKPSSPHDWLSEAMIPVFYFYPLSSEDLRDLVDPLSKIPNLPYLLVEAMAHRVSNDWQEVSIETLITTMQIVVTAAKNGIGYNRTLIENLLKKFFQKVPVSDKHFNITLYQVRTMLKQLTLMTELGHAPLIKKFLIKFDREVRHFIARWKMDDLIEFLRLFRDFNFGAEPRYIAAAYLKRCEKRAIDPILAIHLQFISLISSKKELIEKYMVEIDKMILSGKLRELEDDQAFELMRLRFAQGGQSLEITKEFQEDFSRRYLLEGQVYTPAASRYFFELNVNSVVGFDLFDRVMNYYAEHLSVVDQESLVKLLSICKERSEVSPYLARALKELDVSRWDDRTALFAVHAITDLGLDCHDTIERLCRQVFASDIPVDHRHLAIKSAIIYRIMTNNRCFDDNLSAEVIAVCTHGHSDEAIQVALKAAYILDVSEDIIHYLQTKADRIERPPVISEGILVMQAHAGPKVVKDQVIGKCLYPHLSVASGTRGEYSVIFYLGPDMLLDVGKRPSGDLLIQRAVLRCFKQVRFVEISHMDWTLANGEPLICEILKKEEFL